MQPIPEQINAIDSARIERVRRMTMEERFLEGLQLWSLARETVLAGVRMQFPHATEEEIETLVRQRMKQG